MSRGKRDTGRGGLDYYDRSADASPQARQARRHQDKPPVDELPLLAHLGACWCGAPFGHDWPGKTEGSPHPRDWPGRAGGHGFRS